MLPGQRIGPYEIVSALGSGGMGDVYKARDTRLDRTVALKFAQKAFSGRLAREARLASAATHRSVCRLLDIGEYQGDGYLVLEYIEGEPSSQRLKRGSFEPDEAVALILEILDAVSAMHGRGLVHGDLKPANIMLAADGVRLLDFGLARMLRSSAVQDEATRDLSGRHSRAFASGRPMT